MEIIRGYTGRKLHQIWADWAMHAICYLQKDMTFDFYIGDFGFQKGPLSHFYYVMKCMATFFCVITSSQQQ